MLDPIRERRAAALARPGDLRDLIVDGSRRARAVAHETMERVRAAVRLKY
jgi:tryptophanyl-tRNA synthetase